MAGQNPDRFLGDVIHRLSSSLRHQRRPHPARATGLVHSVTVPAAVRLLLPYLPTEDRQLACLEAWRTAAGIRAGYASPSRVALREQPSGDRAELVERAVALKQVHAVKFVEACWRAHDIDENDVLPVAAGRAVEILKAQASCHRSRRLNLGWGQKALAPTGRSTIHTSHAPPRMTVRPAISFSSRHT